MTVDKERLQQKLGEAIYHISTTQNLMLYDLCNQILEIDKCIRFAGFVRCTYVSRKREGTLLVDGK